MICCDRCKKEIPPAGVHIIMTHAHLCRICYDKCLVWIYGEKGVEE